MPIKTEHFFLEAFLDGDSYLALADKRRFSTIDNQLHRLAEMIGDGRIDGWEVVPLDYPNIRITAGSGLIDGFYINTFDDQEFTLQDQSIAWVYAQHRSGILGTNGPKSNVANIAYNDAGAPAQPSGFNAVLQSEDVSELYSFRVLLTWTSNSEQDLSHYELERSTDAVSFTSVDNDIQPGLTSYQDVVQEDKTYTYRLYAVDLSSNRSPASIDWVVVPVSSVSPPNPTEVQVLESEAALNILWKRPIGIALSQIRWWKITCVRLNSDNSEDSSSELTTLINTDLYNYRFDDLISGERYRITLKTVDLKGRESSGFQRNATPQPSPAPRDPIIISVTESQRATAIGNTSAVLNFSWTDGDTPYDPATTYRYKIYVTPDGQPESIGIDVPLGFTDEQIELFTYDFINYQPLQENKMYTIRLTSLDNAGFESFGTYYRTTISAFSQPKRVANLQLNWNRNNRTITSTWITQPDTYTVHMNIIDDSSEDEYGSPLELLNEQIGLTQKYVLENVELDHTYIFTVKSINASGIESPSSSATISTSPVEGSLPLPEPPPSIEAKAKDREIQLSWSQSSTPYVAYYKLYRMAGQVSLEPEDWELVDTVPSTMLTFSDYGLNNDQIYSYYVTAVDLYDRESLHLLDGGVNVPFVEAIPRREGILTEPDNVQVVLVGQTVVLVWESLAEEFDAFVIYRSINNLHSWEVIATLGKETTTYTDIELPLIDGTTYYYLINKTINDSDIIIQTTSTQPESSIFLAKVTTSNGEFDIDVSDRRDIKNMLDPLTEHTNNYLLPHKHREKLSDPSRIDLSPYLVITNWTTVDGRIFLTTELDITGTSYILRVDGRFPTTFFTVDPIQRRIIFAEPIVSVDDDGEIIGDIPTIELRVLGVEEVQNTLEEFRFNNLHARQIAFGTLNSEQLPRLGHEGRLKESLVPNRFLLERYNGHQFIVPQGNTDETKTFGDGTTFYATIAADGEISEVIDFDQEEDGSLVAFRKPSFSSTTVLNLAQIETENTISLAGNNANQYRFTAGRIYTTFLNRFYSTAISPETYNQVATTSVVISTFTLSSDYNALFGVTNGNSSIYKLDISDGVVLEQKDFSGRQFRGITYDSDRGVFYSYDDSINDIVSIDYDNESVTVVGNYSSIFPVYDLAYAPITNSNPNGTLYIQTLAGPLYTVNLTNGHLTVVSSSTNSLTLTYEPSGNDLYLVNFSTLKNYDIDTGSLTTILDPTAQLLDGVGAPDADWWIPGPSSIKIGNFYGFDADSYLRFSVNVPKIASISLAEITFTSQANSSSSNVSVQISYLNPDGIGVNTDLELESISSVGTLGSVIWSIPTWISDENSQNTTIDVTELVQDFFQREGYFSGRTIIFKILVRDVTSTGHNRIVYSAETDFAPVLRINYVVDSAEVNSEFGGFQSEKSYRFAFQFTDSSKYRWVQITTAETPIKPNPIIDLKKRVRFRIYLESGSLYLSLGVREITGQNLTVGQDGGIVGPIEWVTQNTITDEDGNLVPIGFLINGKAEWQEVDIDLEKASIVSFEGGNNVLSKGYGTLEHLAFTIVPGSENPAGPFEVFIDKIEQINDLLVAGTSQGILLSDDFGVTWNLSRLTSTPVHKFYRAINNRFLWAISTTEVLLATDPAYWFAAEGTIGIQYIRDITEDADGNMYISTDRGVYKLDISLIRSMAVFKPTKTINAFSTDSYALFHNDISSGLDEIWVSTEIGVYKTSDGGTTWQDSGLDTAGLVAYQIFDIGNNTIVAITRKHVLRKRHAESNFVTIANFEVQHDIFDIWKAVYYNGVLYVSTGAGLFASSGHLNSPVEDITFNKTLDDLDYNNIIRVSFGLDIIDLGALGERLFIGQENRLVQIDENKRISIKREFRNKELPSFYIDDQEVMTGFIYNVFNNVVSFREPVQVNKLVSAAHIPRRTFYAAMGGWAQTNSESEVFIYKNGSPTWLDFGFDTNAIIGQMQLLQGKLQTINDLTSFNSLIPQSTEALNSVLSAITVIRTGEENEQPLINSSTVRSFLESYTRFLTLITEDYANAKQLEIIPLLRTGISRDSRPSSSRASIIEQRDGFEAEDSVSIDIDTVFGEVDFLRAYSTTTDLNRRALLSFTKYDKLDISIFNSNVTSTGEFTHAELEDKMELVNTGLTSQMSRVAYTDLIKLGILFESRHNYLFSRYNVSNVQSKFYAAYNNTWYDMLNSTIDYNLIVETEATGESRFSTVMRLFTEDPYFYEKIWVGTDSDILQFGFNSSMELVFESTIQPNPVSSMFILDIWSADGSSIYVIGAEQETRKSHIYVTSDFGSSWTELETINLPTEIYTFRLLNGNKVVSTSDGLFYCDNQFQTYRPSDIVLSDNLGSGSESATVAKGRIFNIDVQQFGVIESERWFYQTSNGIELFGLAGQLTLNNVTTVSKIVRFKNLTWIATDKGLYNDGNSVLTESMAYALQDIENDIAKSATISVNDIAYGRDAIFCGASNGKIYRYWDDPEDTLDNYWAQYQVSSFGPIHKMIIYETGSKDLLIACSYNKIRLIDITPGSGVFG